ncbi:MAG: PEP-CTERM sorting domain-containing protein [Phycisphaerae bacterium]|nr:PEP-CTERM sorting domain-containing protein [Phycisphaerae bacterium]
MCLSPARRVVTATIIVDGATRTSPWGAAGNTKHYDFENGDKIDGASDVIQGKKVFPGTTAASSSPITFDISAGTLNLSQAFGVGGAASATATMTGGEINIADDNYADTGFIVRSNGTFNFGGGVVNLAEQQEADFLIETGGVFNWTTGSTGVFNWTGGDRTSRLTTLASSMTIAGSAATAADFNIAYDSGVTTMTLPEPATMSLLALGGLAMLRRRRS